MELEIKGKPMASCYVDMKQFKAEFRKTFNLEHSIKNNITITDSGILEGELIKKSVYYGLDWGRLIDYLKDDEFGNHMMEVRFFACEYKDKIELTPDVVSNNGRGFIFKEENKSGRDIIMINSFVNSPNYDLRSYLVSSYFNYGTKEWKPILDYKREK